MVLTATPPGQLARHALLSTSDADEYCEQTSKLFTTRYRFEPVARSSEAASVSASVNLVEFGAIKVAYSEFGATTRFVVDEFDCYMVSMQLAGEMHLETQHGSAAILPDQAAMFYPCQSALGTWSGTPMLLVHIQRQALELELERILNRPVDTPVRFDLAMDLRNDVAGSWLATLTHLRREFDRPYGAMSHPVLAKQYENLLIGQLLYAQHHNHTEDLLSPQPPAIPRVINRAVELIESSPEKFFSASDVASAVFVSARTLQDGFRRYVGMPPMAYLRKVRLARVHDELRTTPWESANVTEVACRWGFSHLGRFAADYRKRYGELPSETLRATGPGGPSPIGASSHPAEPTQP